MRKLLFFMLGMFVFQTQVLAQKTITGKVTDESGAPIVSASVQPKGGRGDAGLVKTFANNKKYYISNNNQMYYVQLKKSDVLQALSDKADLLEAFIKDKKISFKKDADMADVVKYYNSL